MRRACGVCAIRRLIKLYAPSLALAGEAFTTKKSHTTADNVTRIANRHTINAQMNLFLCVFNKRPPCTGSQVVINNNRMTTWL